MIVIVFRLAMFVLVFLARMFFARLHIPEQQTVHETATATPQIVIQTSPTAVPPTPTPNIVYPTVTPTPQANLDDSFYIVQSGDDMGSIAAKFGTTVEALAALNGIANPDFIKADQVLSLKSDNKQIEEAKLVPGRIIIVVIQEQKVYAYQDGVLQATFLASTGTWAHPTVLGKYQIWTKLESTVMSGPGYYHPNVLYTMYFYKYYGLHAADWHNNFGHPMSFGCVNLRTDDAKWLFEFASVGTPVWVIP